MLVRGCLAISVCWFGPIIKNFVKYNERKWLWHQITRFFLFDEATWFRSVRALNLKSATSRLHIKVNIHFAHFRISLAWWWPFCYIGYQLQLRLKCARSIFCYSAVFVAIACNLSSFSVTLHLNHFALHIKIRVFFRLSYGYFLVVVFFSFFFNLSLFLSLWFWLVALFCLSFLTKTAEMLLLHSNYRMSKSNFLKQRSGGPARQNNNN